MISALMYPSAIFVLSVVVTAFMLIYIVPKFEGIYKINSTKWDAFYDAKMERVRNYLRTNKEALIQKFHDIEFGRGNGAGGLLYGDLSWNIL